MLFPYNLSGQEVLESNFREIDRSSMTAGTPSHWINTGAREYANQPVIEAISVTIYGKTTSLTIIKGMKNLRAEKTW